MVRKIIGIIFLTLIALPTLVIVIFINALTRTLSSPEFLSDFPIQLIKDSPDLISLFQQQIVVKPEKTQDLNSKVWLAAIAQAQPPLRDLLAQIGLFNWMNTELTDALTTLGNILYGTVAKYKISR